MQTGLDQVRPGQGATVLKMEVQEALCSRLRDFGMVPGTQVHCCYRSPGGQVTALECRGAVIALRTRDLQKIRVRC